RIEESQQSLEDQVAHIAESQQSLEARIARIEMKVEDLKDEQSEIKKQINSIFQQTGNLVEFRTRASAQLDTLSNSMKGVEIITKENLYDITKLKATQ